MMAMKGDEGSDAVRSKRSQIGGRRRDGDEGERADS